MPGAQDRQRREQPVTGAYHERYPAEGPVRVRIHVEVAGRGGRLGEPFQARLHRVGGGEREGGGGIHARTVGDQRVLRTGHQSEPPGDLARLELVLEVGLALVKEVAQDYRGRRAPDGAGQGQVVVGGALPRGDELGQPPVADPQGVDRPPELVDQRQLGVLVGLREADVEADHLGAVSRQHVDEGRELRPRPGPATFGVEALLVDDRHHHRRRGREGASGADAQVVGLQLYQIEEGHADGEERDDEEDAADGQGGRAEREPPAR